MKTIITLTLSILLFSCAVHAEDKQVNVEAQPVVKVPDRDEIELLGDKMKVMNERMAAIMAENSSSLNRNVHVEVLEERVRGLRDEYASLKSEYASGSDRISITILIAIISIVPVIIMPIVIYILNRSGRIGRARQLDYMLKRLELVRKLDEAKQTHGTKDNPKYDWKMVEEEASEILSSIFASMKKQTDKVSKEIANLKKLSRLRRSFLWFKPVTIAGWILLVFFYFSLIGTIEFPLILLLAVIQGRADGETIMILLTVSVAYGFIAFLLNVYAMRSRRKYLAKQEVINQ